MSKSRHTLLVILTLGILTAIGSISIDMYLPAFPIMAGYFGVPIVRIESTVTLFLFGMAFGQLFIGPLSDVWGRKLPLRAGMITYVICSICCMLTHSFFIFLILRFIQGLAGSACQVISRALVNDIYTGNNAARIFSILQILMGISPILAPMIGGMLADASNWKYLFLIMAVISGTGLLGCLMILPEGKPARVEKRFNFPSVWQAYGYSIKSPAFINYALVRAVSNSAAFSFVTGSPFVLIGIYGLSKPEFGFVFSGTAIGIVCVGILNTKMLKRFELRNIIRLASIIQFISASVIILAIYYNAPLSILLIFIFIFLSMLGFILPNATALYLKETSAVSGAASALVGSMSYLSAFLITSLLSVLHNNTAYPVFLVMWGCVAIALVCLHYRR
ncbi:multidrug effflux MFS transporter [Pedobacter hartonius]|uniref:MFS transporter, DHA1 family, bicyclomycin/chloramphenicol resistance protein n=1 Tax=Pedobacter hartonius TaxID=425514 RepID=A0A1H4G916_9SPHI|nr:multidrug effflux MFS transporter [Pedobacter hartonius]SEB05368.1 MFS transporter, DHA1 family, bicyclomycin/chloramphenicol resistance protein [Pedobacter hartonius]